jgi:hypothetical protein
LLVNGAALVGILLVARRRGGTPLLLLVAIGCAVLVRALGPAFVRDPWNPFVPVLPYALLLLLCWSMMRGDRWALPVAAGVASFCAQAHVGYVVLAIPLLLLGAAWLLVPAIRARRRVVDRPVLVALVLLGVMWLPPVIDEVSRSPGNLRRVQYYFRTNTEATGTLGNAYSLIGSQFAAPPAWVDRDRPLRPLSFEPELVRTGRAPVLLLLVGAAAFAFWRRRRNDALEFVLVIGCAALLGVVSIMRTFRPIHDYRLRWASVVGMFGFVVVGWATWLEVARRWPRVARRLLVPAALVALVAMTAVNVADAVRAPPPTGAANARLVDALTSKIVRRLPDRDGVVVVREEDAKATIVQAVFLQLELRGVAVRTDDPHGIIGSGADHRAQHDGEVRAVVIVATGKQLDRRFVERGDDDLIAYSSEQPQAEHLSTVKRIAKLDADYRAGRIGAFERYVNGFDLQQRLRPAVGIFLQVERSS